MPFVPEDGTGLPNANAYIDLAFANTYHSDRGNDGWGQSDGNKRSAIIRATDYIEQRFGLKFRGVRKTKEQALEWPRLDAFDDDDFAFSSVDEIPRQLQKACAEYALRALNILQLSPDPTLSFATRDATGEGSTQQATADGGEVRRKKEKVGPIEEEIEYRSTAQALSRSDQLTDKGTSEVPSMFIPAYPTADLWIQELLRGATSRTLSRG
jgi:hypothetical protein